jgi:hypothetical protein
MGQLPYELDPGFNIAVLQGLKGEDLRVALETYRPTSLAGRDLFKLVTQHGGLVQCGMGQLPELDDSDLAFHRFSFPKPTKPHWQELNSQKPRGKRRR